MEGFLDFEGTLEGMIHAGTEVEITPTLSTGTKIADYSIDNVPGELYAPTGGGSDVEITPTLSTGTKIADYEIDGVSGELYAPTGGGSDVEITPTLSTGTKIADYEIDGVSGSMYAPTPLSSYNDLSNKPSINNVTLTGNMNINEVPSYSASDDGKFLGVNNGSLSWLEAGSSGAFEADNLFHNTAASIPNSITLSESISDYDMIVLTGYRNNMTTYYCSDTYLADDLVTGRLICLTDDSSYAWYTVTSDTVLTKAGANIIISDIYGIKFGSGGGSSTPSYSSWTNSFINKTNVPLYPTQSPTPNTDTFITVNLIINKPVSDKKLFVNGLDTIARCTDSDSNTRNIPIMGYCVTNETSSTITLSILFYNYQNYSLLTADNVVIYISYI